MKKRNYLFILAIIGLVASAFSGCKADDTDSNSYVIGGIGPVTGENAMYGLSVKQGAEIAVNEINEKGGVDIKGQKIALQLKFEDDEASEEKAILAYNILQDNGMDALLGCVTTKSTLAVVDLSNQDNILQLTPTASSGEVTKHKNVFRACFTNFLQGETMADYMVRRKGYRKIGVIYKSSSEYSREINDSFQNKVFELGGEVVSSETYVDGENFTAQLENIKKNKAQAIFIPVYYGDAYKISNQVKDKELDIPLFGADGWDGIVEVANDKSVIEGATFISQFYSESWKDSEFVKKYKEKYNEEPDQFAADGYDSVYIIKAALEEAGSTDSEKVIEAMTKIKVDGITGTDISFNEDGEPHKKANFINIKNGNYVTVGN